MNANAALQRQFYLPRFARIWGVFAGAAFFAAFFSTLVGIGQKLGRHESELGGINLGRVICARAVCGPPNRLVP
jgi:hypothetical protein